MKIREMSIGRLVKEASLAKETVYRSRCDKIEACTLKTLNKIATALGVKVKDLFDEE